MLMGFGNIFHRLSFHVRFLSSSTRCCDAFNHSPSEDEYGNRLLFMANHKSVFCAHNRRWWMVSWSASSNQIDFLGVIEFVDVVQHSKQTHCSIQSNRNVFIVSLCTHRGTHLHWLKSTRLRSIWLLQTETEEQQQHRWISLHFRHHLHFTFFEMWISNFHLHFAICAR